MVAQDDLEAVLRQGTLNAPASEALIANLERTISVTLPAAYRDFLKRSNGFEGFLANDRYLVLWSVEQIVELNEAYSVAEFAAGLLLIGSDGGDTGYGFDTRIEPMKVCEVPFVGMSLQTIKPLAESFDKFLKGLQDADRPSG